MQATTSSALLGGVEVGPSVSTVSVHTFIYEVHRDFMIYEYNVG